MVFIYDVATLTELLDSKPCLWDKTSDSLFSWRYNPLWLYFHSPVAGFSLLVFEVS